MLELDFKYPRLASFYHVPSKSADSQIKYKWSEDKWRVCAARSLLIPFRPQQKLYIPQNMELVEYTIYADVLLLGFWFFLSSSRKFESFWLHNQQKINK